MVTFRLWCSPFLINPKGASEVDPGCIDFKPGAQPIHNTLLREGPPPHLSRWFYRTPPTLKMYSGPEIYEISPRNTVIFARYLGIFLEISKTGDATHFRHGKNVAAGVPTFGSKSGPMGTKLAHFHFTSSRSNFSQRRALDLRRQGVVLVSCKVVDRND